MNRPHIPANQQRSGNRRKLRLDPRFPGVGGKKGDKPHLPDMHWWPSQQWLGCRRHFSGGKKQKNNRCLVLRTPRRHAGVPLRVSANPGCEFSIVGFSRVRTPLFGSWRRLSATFESCDSGIDQFVQELSSLEKQPLGGWKLTDFGANRWCPMVTNAGGGGGGLSAAAFW